MVGGNARVSAKNYERLRPDSAPPLASAARARRYRIVIKGVPDMQFDLAFGGADPLTDAVFGTGMRAAHSNPAVCAAKTGIVRSLADLPHVHGYRSR